mgnify:CR=1 FL=1
MAVWQEASALACVSGLDGLWFAILVRRWVMRERLNLVNGYRLRLAEVVRIRMRASPTVFPPRWKGARRFTFMLPQ